MTNTENEIAIDVTLDDGETIARTRRCRDPAGEVRELIREMEADGFEVVWCGAAQTSELRALPRFGNGGGS